MNSDPAGREWVVCLPIRAVQHSNGILGLARIAQELKASGRRVRVAPTQNYPNQDLMVALGCGEWDVSAAAAALFGLELLVGRPPPGAVVMRSEGQPRDPYGSACRVVWHAVKPGALGRPPVDDPGAYHVVHSPAFRMEVERTQGRGPDCVLFFGEMHPAFTDAGAVPARLRDMDCHYAGKGVLYGECPAPAGTLPILRDWPNTKEALALLLRRTRLLYSHDAFSNILAEAVLCGAVPMVLGWGPWTPSDVDGGPFGRLPRMEPGAEPDWDGFEAGREVFMRRVREAGADFPAAVRRMADGAEAKFAADAASVASAPAPARLAACIITSSREGIVGDAVRSCAAWVDGFAVLDLGIADGTLDAIRTAADGRPVSVTRFEGDPDGPEGLAPVRDAVLGAAHAAGYTHGLILDTDERLELRGEDVAAVLADPEPEVWLARDLEQGYTKPRIVRLPAARKYVCDGGCHEEYPLTDTKAAVLERLVFREQGRTAEAARGRDLFIVERLTAALAREERPRWRLYRGHALHALGRDAEVADDLRVVIRKGSPEEAGVAGWLLAEAYLCLKRHDEAVGAACAGMARHPGMAELPWMAAVASAAAGRAAEALCWARLSQTLGRFRGFGWEILRIGHANPQGQWEGPYEVEAWALEALGRGGEAGRARTDAEAAKAMRLAGGV